MRMIIRALDIILTFIFAVLVVPVFALFFILFILIMNLRNTIRFRGTVTGRKNLLRLVPSNLDDLKKREYLSKIYESDENGYFDHVYTVHYPTQKSQVIPLNERHTVIEIGKIAVYLKAGGLYFLYIFLNGIYFLRKIIGMRKFVSENIDIIRGQGPDHMGVAAIVLHSLTTIPYCVSVHGDDDKRYKITRGKGVYLVFGSKIITDLIRTFVLSKAPMVMVIRESLIPFVRNHGARAENIRVIPHGIPLEGFESGPDFEFEREWRQGDKKLVVFAGRLSPENYIEDIIQIAAEVRLKVPLVRFLILGEGIERGKAEALSERLDLSNNIVFAGFQPLEKVKEFRKIADVNLCLMAGFSLIEAAAAGRPVVSYDVEWHYELVRNDETGYLIREHDIAGASEAIVRLINDPALAKRLGENARRLAFKNYDIKQSSRIKILYHDELLSRHAHRI